jgi:hypothetical protein
MMVCLAEFLRFTTGGEIKTKRPGVKPGLFWV